MIVRVSLSFPVFSPFESSPGVARWRRDLPGRCIQIWIVDVATSRRRHGKSGGRSASIFEHRIFYTAADAAAPRQNLRFTNVGFYLRRSAATRLSEAAKNLRPSDAIGNHPRRLRSNFSFLPPPRDASPFAARFIFKLPPPVECNVCISFR